jgi:HD-GYP domain-containing protein (c-di-GMP phosphodiesterase class II)
VLAPVISGSKSGPLTSEEREVVDTHTVVGEEMLAKVGGPLGVNGRFVRSRHERWDGTGYPDRLAGEAIRLVSRIVCACDAFDAMTTDRPYRDARSPEEALAELRRCAGSRFDPVVVETIADVVELDDVCTAAAWTTVGRIPAWPPSCSCTRSRSTSGCGTLSGTSSPAS